MSDPTEGRVLKVVADTNLFIAAYWNRNSASAAILRACREGRLHLCYTPAIRREIEYILGQIKASASYRQEVEDTLRSGTEFESEGKLHIIDDDPDDDKFLECARVAGVDYLISSDTHLLSLGSFDSTIILKPGDFQSIADSNPASNVRDRERVMHAELFRDREEAGRRLADRLLDYSDKDAIVLAIPRGGVPVGYQIAERLHVPMDLIVPRKIPIPWNPEAGFGAITEDGTMVLNEPMVRSLDLREDEIEQAASEVRAEIDRRVAQYRGDLPPPSLEGRAVILVDDGLASGYTMLAAIQSARKRNPASVTVAVPVASSGAARLVSPKADHFVAIIIGERLPFAVADFYSEWRDLTDKEVCEYIRRSARG